MHYLIIYLYRIMATALIMSPAILNFEHNSGLLNSLLYIPAWMTILTLLFIYIDERLIHFFTTIQSLHTKRNNKKLSLTSKVFHINCLKTSEDKRNNVITTNVI